MCLAILAKRIAKKERTMILYILDMDKFLQSEYCFETSGHKKPHVAGQYLLSLALGKESCEKAVFSRGKHGKPFIEGYPIHYNISHSGNYVVLVSAESEVGVDIQEKRSVHAEALAKRFFTEAETEPAVRGDFYHIWCRKEAYGKYLGVGLNEQVLHTNVVDEEWNMPGSNYEFHDLSLIPGYQISICSRKGEYIEKIIRVFEGL